MTALGLLFALPSVVAAQVPDSTRTDTTVFRVEGIRVQATRPVTTVGGASAFEVELDSMQLPAAATTAEVLRELPSLHLRTNSRGEAEVTVRGSESRQVAVLVDGIPLTLGWDARTDVSVLPAGAVKDVTVVRGLSTLLHGPNVLGGVVEMQVGQGRSFPTTSSLVATAGLDNNGGFGTSVVGETPFDTGGGQGVIRVGGSYRDSPGFPLPGGVSEPVPTGDDLRLNTDVNNLNGFAAVRYEADGEGVWGSLSASSFKAERGIAAELGVEDPRRWRYPDIRRTLVAVSGGTGQRETPWGQGDLEAAVGIDLGSTEINSYNSLAYDQVDGTELGDSRTVTFRALADHTLGRRGELRTAFTVADIFHEATEDGVAEEFQQRLLSLAAESVWRLVDDPGGALEALRLSFGGAWDRGTTPKTGGRTSLGTLDDWGARVGLSALMNDGSTLIHAGLSRRGRFPALRESYSEALDRFVPNPDLAPEHLVSLEGGITTRVGSGDLQVVGFHNRFTDAIRRITLSDGMRQRVNSDELESTGLEVLFSQNFGRLSLGGDLLLQQVTLTDPGAAISTQPENMPEQQGRLWLKLPLVAGIAADGEVEYTGSQYCQDPDSGADVELDGGSWFNAGLSKVWSLSSSRTLARRLETRVSAVNLGDTALYDQCGLPRQGRQFRFQIRLF
jgi:iron complex outermembrane receptor protein